MANGTEVVLGFAQPEYARVREALGIRIPLTAEEWEACRDDGPEEFISDMGPRTPGSRRPESPRYTQIADLLKEAHLECIATLGRVLGETEDDRHVIAETPLGEREFARFTVELFYDWSEMNERPEDTTFGIALSGRYFPTFLDWKDPSGTLWPVRLDQATLHQIAIARAAIEKRLPIFADAHLAVIERHY